MTLKLFEFLEQIMIDPAMIKSMNYDHIEKKTGTIGNIFISPGDLKTKLHFRNYNSITFFGTFILLLFDRGFFFPLNKANELNLRMNQKSNREKVHLSLKFFLKKTQELELRSLTLKKPAILEKS